MKLEQIHIFGFKSFADKEELKILPGITAIVGPNGCGKSNIADAIRWVLGEQSIKTLRGAKMEDIIFHGSPNRKPLGMAEVSLILSNNNGQCSLPYSEIMVTRRYFRSGDSEYFLNKKPCRLKEIIDIFMDTGAGIKAYSLMDQERLNLILSSKPADRRYLIEEAAGITKYKARKTEALNKLEAAKQNLLRVEDVIGEIKRQLDSLSRQAAKARRYKRLVESKNEIEIFLLSHELNTHVVTKEKLMEEIGILKEREKVVNISESMRDAEIEKLKIESLNQEKNLNSVREKYHRVDTELLRLIDGLVFLDKQDKESESEKKRILEELNSIGEKSQNLNRKVFETQQEILVVENELQNKEELLIKEENLLKNIQEDLKRVKDSISESRNKAFDIINKIALYNNENAGLIERRKNQIQKIQRIEDEKLKIKSELEEILEKLATLINSVDSKESEKEQFQIKRDEIAEQLKRLEKEKEAIDENVRKLETSFAKMMSRKDSLEELEKNREGYESGIKEVFKLYEEGALNTENILGTVADFIETDSRFEKAVESALGERMQYIVVKTLEDALGITETLKRINKGWATFIPLNISYLYIRNQTIDKISENGSSAYLPEDIIKTDERFIPILNYLLRNTLIVDKMEMVKKYLSQNGSEGDNIFVSTEGEMITQTGIVTGGGAENNSEKAHGIMVRKRMIREISDEITRFKSLLDDENDKKESFITQIEIKRTEIQEGDLKATALIMDINSGRKDIENITREKTRITKYLESLDIEKEQIEYEISQNEKEIRERESIIGNLENTRQNIENELSSHIEIIEDMEKRSAELSDRCLELRVEVTSIRGKKERMLHEIEKINELIEDLSLREKENERLIKEIDIKTGNIRKETEENKLRVESTTKEKNDTELELRQKEEVYQEVLDSINSKEREIKEIQREKSTLISEIHEKENHLAEVNVRIANTRDNLREKYNISDISASASTVKEIDIDEKKSELKTIENKITALGPVNMIADDEYRELEERLKFMTEQRDDLFKSIDDLEKAISVMTKTSRERFIETFEIVNRNFSSVFERLFGGGKAEIRLIEPEDPLESGVDIIAKPPGKKLQNIMLLSGGEKALTGLSLLFAIFLYKPSPFCFLDEVDAPLDDANIVGFTELLRDFSDRTQFILITHNKKTMEAADVLYGVTMVEPGLSKLVSVQLTN